MKIALCSSFVPFLKGGAKNIVECLESALQEAGHQVERVYLPATYHTAASLFPQMMAYRWVDLADAVDRIICFRPPAHLIPHPQKILWFIHHLRAFYDLWDTQYRGFPDDGRHRGLREAVHAIDTAAFREARQVFTNSQVVSDRIRTYNTSTSSIALGGALETGLLDMLAEKAMTGDEVVQAMNIPSKRGFYWLQLLTELGILEKDSQEYAPSPIMRTVISDNIRLDRWKHAASDERERLAGLRNLALHVSEPGSLWKAQGLTDPKNDYEKMIEDPERARVYTRLLYNFYMGSKNEFADLIDMTGVKRMMDVGGGSGIVSILLVNKFPGLRSVVVEFENVCIEDHLPAIICQGGGIACQVPRDQLGGGIVHTRRDSRKV